MSMIISPEYRKILAPVAFRLAELPVTQKHNFIWRCDAREMAEITRNAPAHFRGEPMFRSYTAGAWYIWPRISADIELVWEMEWQTIITTWHRPDGISWVKDNARYYR